MSNIVIYLPNEPLGKQGGMEGPLTAWPPCLPVKATG